MSEGRNEKTVQEEVTRGRGLALLRVALFVGSIAAIAYGITDGEPLSVMAKGIRVCLECIGIA